MRCNQSAPKYLSKNKALILPTSGTLPIAMQSTFSQSATAPRSVAHAYWIGKKLDEWPYYPAFDTRISAVSCYVQLSKSFRMPDRHQRSVRRSRPWGFMPTTGFYQKGLSLTTQGFPIAP